MPGTLLVPGHDLTMRLDASGQPAYVGQRRAGIGAWFAETLEDTTNFDMSETEPAVSQRPQRATPQRR